MSDVFDKEVRSAVMSRVRSKANKSTEIRMIELFRTNHITGWKRNYKVKGNPDFVFLEKRIVVFVDGCFWHGHDCRNTRPKDNQEYWKQKRERNMQRDLYVTALFEARGWIVLRIWECELKRTKIDSTMEIIRRAFNQEHGQ